MTATGIILFIVGIWILVNAVNLIDVFTGKTTFTFIKGERPAGHGPRK